MWDRRGVIDYFPCAYGHGLVALAWWVDLMILRVNLSYSTILSPTYPQLSGCHWEHCSQPAPASSGPCCCAGSSTKLGHPEARYCSNANLYRKQTFNTVVTHLLKNTGLRRSHAPYTSACSANYSHKVSSHTYMTPTSLFKMNEGEGK